MDPQIAIDIGRQAVIAVLVLSAPVLLVAAITGLFVGTLQTLTQIQDQSILFVARLFAAIIVIGICMPWFVEYYTGFSRDLIQQIPANLFGIVGS